MGRNSIEKMQLTDSFVFSKDRDVQAIGRLAKKLDRSSHMSRRSRKFKSISPVNIDSTGVLPETVHQGPKPCVIQGEKKVIGVKRKQHPANATIMAAPIFKQTRESPFNKNTPNETCRLGSIDSAEGTRSHFDPKPVTAQASIQAD